MFPVKILCVLFGVFLQIQASDRIRLRDVQVLNLKEGDWTAGRRGSPVPQLNCVGGSARDKFVPKVVQCYNRGWDGNQIQWECKTDMDNDYRFGEITVTCEGYAYPGDDYILKGSCGLEYELDYTKEGLYKRQRESFEYEYDTLIRILAILLFLFIIGCIIYAVSSASCSGCRRRRRRRRCRPDDPPSYSEDESDHEWFCYRWASAPHQQRPYVRYGRTRNKGQSSSSSSGKIFGGSSSGTRRTSGFGGTKIR